MQLGEFTNFTAIGDQPDCDCCVVYVRALKIIEITHVAEFEGVARISTVRLDLKNAEYLINSLENAVKMLKQGI